MTAAEMYKDLKAGSEDFAPYKDRILFRVIPRKKAEEQELARLNLYDLAIVFEIPLDANVIIAGGEDSDRKQIMHEGAIVSELQSDLWMMPPAALYEHALANTQKARPLQGGTIGCMLRAMDPGMPEEAIGFADKSQLYVVTNDDGYMGFGALFYKGVLEGLQKKMGRFWIIPASVHEALVMPADTQLPPKHIRDIIAFVNETEVEERDWLSDSLYMYNPETMEIEICRGGEADE